VEVKRIAPATGGLDTDSSAAYMGAATARELTNLLTDRKGKLLLRGPINADAQTPASATWENAWAFNDKILATRLANTNMHYDPDTGVVTTITVASSDLVPGPSWARVDANVYGIPWVGVLARASSSAAWHTKPLIRWNGGDTAGSIVSQTTASPRGARCVASHLGRLFVAGGSKPGTASPVYNNKLWWSDVLGPSADTVAQWSDDSSGIVNELTIDSENADYPVALASLPNGLAILRKHSIMLLSGSTPSTFSIRKVSEVGCMWPQSVVTTEDGVYFMSERGYVYFDGVTPQYVSDAIQTELLDSAGIDLAVMLTDSFMLCRPAIDLRGDDSLYLFDTRRMAWSRVALDASTSKVWGMVRTASHTFLLTLTDVWDAGDLAQPTSTQDNADFKLDWPMRAIVPTLHTRIERLASPVQRAQLNHVIVEYEGDTNGQWSIELRDESDNVILASTMLPEGAAGRRREKLECFAEAREIQARLTWTCNDLLATATRPALYDITVEYQVTHK
jgi:hypothetical protein